VNNGVMTAADVEGLVSEGLRAEEQAHSAAERAAHEQERRRRRATRKATRTQQRADAKKMGHKLGHNNVRCKRCGQSREFIFVTSRPNCPAKRK